MKKDKSSDHEPTLFRDLIDKILEEEQVSYDNKLIPFQQHADKIKREIADAERNYLARLERGIKLLSDHFKQ